MENLIYFMLGVGTVLLIGIVVFVFNMIKKINKLSSGLDGLQPQLQNIYNEFDRIRNEQSKDNEVIYREMDSRLDKLANKFQLEKKENNKQ